MNHKKAFILGILMTLIVLERGFGGKVESSQEYRKGANIYTPIVHQKYFKGERELLGYNPKYTPNVISFDAVNKPYIRTEEGFVQTLDERGQWLRNDFKPFIKQSIPNWDGSYGTGAFAEERIIFDAEGDAYMSVKSKQWMILMHSRDHCKTWAVYRLPMGSHCGIETESPFFPSTEPPCLSLEMKEGYFIILPKKQADGTLIISPPVLISPNAFYGPLHSGGGNVTRTVKGVTYVVYASSVPQKGEEGTPQFITRYDHASKALSAPFYMGCNGTEVDGHNIPSMEVDSKGYLHVLLGSHHDPFVHFKSIKPYDISGWSKPVLAGVQKTKMGEGSFTYSGLIIDKFDTLHVVSRWGGSGYKDLLVYSRKLENQAWEPLKVLVEPFKTRYSVWYHKVSQDAYGRIFISYKTYSSELTKEEFAGYLNKWPEEKASIKVPQESEYYPNGIEATVKPHDPCMLVSNDGGDSFRLTLTEDLQAGAMPQNVKPGEKKDNSIGMALVKIPAGRFIMGSLDGALDEKPVHAVSITKPFYIGQNAVRVKDFAEFVKATGYQTEFELAPIKSIFTWMKGSFENPAPEVKRALSWRSPGIPQTDEHPVVAVTVKDARAFCAWLSKKEGRTYRLPTEAEREYASRAGTITRYSFGDSTELLPKYGWYKSNAKGTQPVGNLLPNPFGLYDMQGNVWEYCEDIYGAYSDWPKTDPVAKVDPQYGPIIRGGSWIDDRFGSHTGFNLRSACRYHVYYPLVIMDWVGFRVVME